MGPIGKRIPEISGQLGWRSFGLMLQNPDNPHGAPFEYTAAVQMDQESDIPEGMTYIEVPAARYIVLIIAVRLTVSAMHSDISGTLAAKQPL